jgi:RNA polymerase sigma-70 factor (ECF subfamily)
MTQPISSDHTATSPPISTQAPFVESVERARIGDQNAFRCLFDFYYGQICTYLAHLISNTEVGHDLAQETFLRAWKGLQKVQGEIVFRPWLYRIATNVARSYLQRERLISWLPWFDYARSPQAITSTTFEPEALLEEQEMIAEILATLPQQCRSCLLLQHVAGFSQREIASILNISEKSVSAYVSRGREQFRRTYRRLKEGASLS